MSKPIIFFGNERLATGVTTKTPVLKALVLNGYRISAIVSGPYSTQASRKKRSLEIAGFAENHQIPLIEWLNTEQLIKEVVELKAEVGILAAFGKLVPQSVINIFPKGIINIHPSLLPKHRGPIPIEATILAGDSETGVSIMKLVAAMDAGPVYDQVLLPLNGSETKQALADQLGELGAKSLVENLPKILSGELKPIDQPADGISYNKRLDKTMGMLDFNKPAAQLVREVRAFLGWPRSHMQFQNKDLVVTEARETDFELPLGEISAHNRQLLVGTVKGSLVIDRLVPAGGKEMTAAEYLHGHRF